MSRIDALTSDLREAGLGKLSTPFYGSYFHGESHDYHLHGDTWPDKQLQLFFKEGLLKYYIGYFSRVNLNEHTAQKETLFWIVSGLIPYDSHPSSPEDLEVIAKKCIHLMRALTTSKPLLELGAHFQRAKVICEKLDKKGDFGDGYLTQSKKAEVLQTAICRWVEFYVNQTREKLAITPTTAIDSITVSLTCPPHILEYLKDNDIPSDELPRTLMTERDTVFATQTPVALSRHISPHEKEAVRQFFDGFSFGSRSFWKGKNIQDITLAMIIHHAKGGNKIAHRFMMDEYTGSDTRKRLETLFDIDFKKLSESTPDDLTREIILKTQVAKATGYTPSGI